MALSVKEDAFLSINEDGNVVRGKDAAIHKWPVLIVGKSSCQPRLLAALTQISNNDRRLEVSYTLSSLDALAGLTIYPAIVFILESSNRELVEQILQHIRNKSTAVRVMVVSDSLLSEDPFYNLGVEVLDLTLYASQAELLVSLQALFNLKIPDRTFEPMRESLQGMLLASANLVESEEFFHFSSAALMQIALVIGVAPASIVCVQECPSEHGTLQYWIYQAFRSGSEEEPKSLESLENLRIAEQLKASLQSKTSSFTGLETILYIQDKLPAAVHVDSSSELQPQDLALLELYVRQMALGRECVKAIQELQKTAFRDSLTQIPNRTEFCTILQDMKLRAADSSVAVLVDIDHFSDVNDGLGQEAGSELLVEVAKRLTVQLEDGVQVARIGGDVFGLVGPRHLLTPERLNLLFEQPFQCLEHSLQVSVTLGFCFLDDSAWQGQAILKQVNTALNFAKKLSSRNFDYYDEQVEVQLQQRLALLRALRFDFQQNRLELWYQPQVCLKTQKVLGFEALLRWKAENGTYIPPSEFIPLAEYSGLIIDIGDWVLRQACLMLKQLTEKGCSQRIAVNVSMPQFRTHRFVQSVLAVIEQTKVDASLLELEITESVLMDDPEGVIRAVKELKAAGVKIAIDDFGIGFSSLSYLQLLPLDRIKIDRMFIKDIEETNYPLLAETIVHLGKKLGLITIAEGIETEGQAAILVSLGCEEGQGFLYSKALPEAEVFDYLIKHR